MEGIENILRVGKKDAPSKGGVNKYAEFVDDCAGLDHLEQLQRHDNEDIYDKAVKILKEYFESEEDDGAPPAVDDQTNTFAFNANNNNAPVNKDFNFDS